MIYTILTWLGFLNECSVFGLVMPLDLILCSCQAVRGLCYLNVVNMSFFWHLPSICSTWKSCIRVMTNKEKQNKTKIIGILTKMLKCWVELRQARRITLKLVILSSLWDLQVTVSPIVNVTLVQFDVQDVFNFKNFCWWGNDTFVLVLHELLAAVQRHSYLAVMRSKSWNKQNLKIWTWCCCGCPCTVHECKINK